MNPRGVGLAAASLAVAGLAAGVAAYRSRHTAEQSPPPSSVRVPVGVASSPTASDGAADLDAGVDAALPLPKIPEHLPDFSLADRSGKPTSIEKWKDQSLIINFWATWCAPCRREIPLLRSLRRDWRDRDVEVVGIAVDHLDNVRTFADDLKIPYPLLVGEQDALEVAAAFGFKSPVFPFTVFTDRRGEVVTLYVGELHQPEANLILSVVLDLDQNRVALSEARRNISAGLRALPSHRPD